MKLFAARSRVPAPRRPKGPTGKRCYAIGDVHGCLDLLRSLVAKIEADIALRPQRETSIVFLGDLIDRGPDSRGVVEFVRRLAPASAKVYLILGNHEEMLLRGLSGEPDLIPQWLGHGGLACAVSYGVAPQALSGGTLKQLEAVLRSAIPQAHLDFLADGLDCARFGDFFLTHAGVRPGIRLDQQAPRDLRWIRDGFLDVDTDPGAVIVHGHTISDDIDHGPHRIGVDLGAYRTGRLAAVRLEDDEIQGLSVEEAVSL